MRKLSRLFVPLAAFTLLALISFSQLQSETVIYLQCVASLCIYLWIVFSWRSATGLLNAYLLFATAVFLFNAGQTILYSLRGTDSLLNGRFSDATLADTLTMVNFYLVAMHTGASMVASIRAERRPSRSISPVPVSGQTCATRVAWILSRNAK